MGTKYSHMKTQWSIGSKPWEPNILIWRPSGLLGSSHGNQIFSYEDPVVYWVQVMGTKYSHMKTQWSIGSKPWEPNILIWRPSGLLGPSHGNQIFSYEDPVVYWVLAMGTTDSHMKTRWSIGSKPWEPDKNYINRNLFKTISLLCLLEWSVFLS
jgi:hypothetical protein